MNTTKGTMHIMEDVKTRPKSKRCCLKKAGKAVVEHLLKSRADLNGVSLREAKSLLVQMCREQKRGTCS